MTTWRNGFGKAICLSVVAVTTMGVLSLASAASAATHHSIHVKRTIVRDGYKCTVVSSAQNHNLVGQAGDVVCALGGKNTLTAVGAGHVVLIGARGKDTLVGSSTPGAVDTLIGGKGSDTIVGGPAGTNDVIQTGTGNDNIDCGSAQVTIAGAGPDDTEGSDCSGSGDVSVTQHWHGTVVSVASDNSTVSISVSEANDGAQAWLATQSPPCVQSDLTFDLTTNPANVQVDGGGPLTPGDDIEIEAQPGPLNCEPVAVNVEAQPADNQDQQGDTSQHWEGQVVSVATDGSTMNVAISDSSDGAQAWLEAQSPPCNTQNLVFDLKSAPANIQVDGGGPLAATDQVEIEATAGSVECVPVADEVHASPPGGDQGGNDQGGGGGWGGGDQGGGGTFDGGAFGTVVSVNGSTASTACGGTIAGYFVVSPPWSSSTTTTVTVDPNATTFVEPGVDPASFANVCVGDIAGAVGTGSGGSLSATWVFVAPAGWNDWSSS